METVTEARRLSDVEVGKTYRVESVNGSGPVRRRIMDMGITKGTQIKIRKVAPFGDPVQINLRGYELTFRRADGENVLLEEIA